MRTDPALQALAPWTLAAGLLLLAGIVVLKLGQMPGGDLFQYKGLIQQAILVIFMAWLFALAVTAGTLPSGTLNPDPTETGAASGHR